MKTKRLSLILALVMIISAFAGTFTFASAEDAGVWEVGGTKYATLKEAFDNRGSETTIYLTGNYTATETATIFPAIGAAETVTIKSKSTSNYTITTPAHRYIQMRAAEGGLGTLKFEGVNIDASTAGKSGIIQMNSGKLYFTNGTVKFNNNYAFILQAGTYFEGENMTFNVTGKGTGSDYASTAVRLNEAGAHAKLTGFIHIQSDYLTDSIMNAGASNVTLEIVDASIRESGKSHTQRIFKSQSKGTTVIVSNSSIMNTGSGAIIELQQPGTAEAPNTVTVTNSNLKITADSGYGIRVTSTASYSNVTVTDSIIEATMNALVVANASCTNTTFNVTNSQLISNTTNVVVGIADTVVNITDSTLYSKAGAALSTTAANTTLVRTGMVSSDTTFETTADLGAVNAENADVIAAALGFAFRGTDKTAAYADGAFTGYYRTLATATAATQSVYQIADYVAIDNVQSIKASNPVVIEMNGHSMAAGVYVRLANIYVSTTFKNGTLTTREASGLFQTNDNAGTVLTLDNVDIIVNIKLNNAPIVVTTASTTVNIINGTTLTANMAYDNQVVYTNKNDTVINVIDSTITKKAVTRPAYFTGSNNNVGLVSSGVSVTITIANSTIDFGEGYKDRIIYTTKASTSSLTLINANLIASCGSGHISWYDATTIHMYGNNTFTGGDRLVEFAAAGVNSFQELAKDDKTLLAPSIDTLDGAGVRTVKDSSGIRFISTISADVVAGLEATYAGKFSYGTIVMKASDLEGTTVDAAIAAGKQYVDIAAVNGIVENKDGSVNIYAAMVNIKEKNYDVEFAGIAYIDITIAEGVIVRIYSDYNAEDNARSIEYVAKKALGDVKTTSSNELVDGFRYNNELAVGETYYVDGVAKVVAEGEKLYSAYNADQRAVIAAYLA